MHRLLVGAVAATLVCAQEKVDLATIQRIKREAFQNSKVMDHLFWLTDVYGPRLTGSPGFTVAADWAIKQLKEHYQLTVLMAEQNFTQAIRIADRGYVIVHGKIAFEGRSTDELNNNDLIRQFYLGM